MQTHHEIIPLRETTPCQVHHVSDPVQGNLRQCSHKKEGQAENLIPREGDFAEHQKVRELVEVRANRAAQGEQEALSKLSETEYHTRILLGKQRNQILSETKFELLLQETRAEHAVNSFQNLNRQLRSQETEICRRGQEL